MKFLMFLLTVKYIFGVGLVEARTLQIGDTPKLVATRLSGESFDLSQKKGKWVIVNFFATWCPGCKTELPKLAAVYQKYHAKNLEMILISPEPARKKKDVVNFIKDFEVKTAPLPVALLAETKASDFGSSISLPTTYVIDPAGKIKMIFMPPASEFDEQQIEAVIYAN